MEMMGSFLRSFCVLVFILVGVSSEANQILEYSLEEKIKRSDIVVLGRVSALSKEMSSGFSIEFADISVLGVLGGSSEVGDSIRFVYHEGVDELSSDCCEVGEEYLLFLSREGNGMYFSVNGQFGVYRIDHPKY